MHTPDKPLDGVSIIVQDEDDWGQLIGDHRRQFLGSELPERNFQYAILALYLFMYSQTSITDEKDSPSQLEIPCSTGGTKGSTDAIPNTTPQDLGNKSGILWHGDINDTEARSPSLGNNDILRLQELRHAGPQVCLSDGVVGLIGNRVDEWRNGDLLSNFPEFSQLGCQIGKESLEADSGVKRVQNLGMAGMKLMRVGQQRQ